jgi:hypothetical protein
MPGLLRGVARTAVVAGTATAVSNGFRAVRRNGGRKRSRRHIHLRGIRSSRLLQLQETGTSRSRS